MEAIADGELRIWHLSVRHPESMKDLNIADNSRTISRFLSGNSPPRIPFIINGRARTCHTTLLMEFTLHGQFLSSRPKVPRARR